MTPSRDVEIDPAQAALLFIDIQNYTCGPDGGEYAAMDPAERDGNTAGSSAPCNRPPSPTCSACSRLPQAAASRCSTP